MTKRIIFVTGYPGAGKTTLLKQLMAESAHQRTWLREDTPFKDHPLRGVPRTHEMGSTWTYCEVPFMVAGCHRKPEPNKQGADIFVSMSKYEVIDWCLQQSDTLIWDSFNVGAQMLQRLANHDLTYLQVDVPRTICEARRDARRDPCHHSAKTSATLQWQFDGVDRRWREASTSGLAYCLKSHQPLEDIMKKLLQP